MKKNLLMLFKHSPVKVCIPKLTLLSVLFCANVSADDYSMFINKSDANNDNLVPLYTAALEETKEGVKRNKKTFKKPQSDDCLGSEEEDSGELMLYLRRLRNLSKKRLNDIIPEVCVVLEKQLDTTGGKKLSSEEELFREFEISPSVLD